MTQHKRQNFCDGCSPQQDPKSNAEQPCRLVLTLYTYCCLGALLVSEVCGLLQDPEIQARMLWKGMAVIRPWDAIPEAVLAIEPHILDDTSIRNGELDVEQKEVLQVIWSDLRLTQHIKVNFALKE